MSDVATPTRNLLFAIFSYLYILLMGVYIMAIRLFRWDEMTAEQRLDVVTANTIVLIFFVFSVALYANALAFKSIFILALAIVSFGFGIFLATIYFKRARKGGPIFADLRVHYDKTKKKVRFFDGDVPEKQEKPKENVEKKKDFSAFLDKLTQKNDDNLEKVGEIDQDLAKKREEFEE